MNFLKPDLLRSFGIGFVLGCAALAMTMGLGGFSDSVLPSAVAATSK